MSTFERRYTERQRRAVAVAQLDQGRTAAQAASALMAGELTDAQGAVPPPADAMPKSTAGDLARRLRAEREGRRGGLAGAEPTAARAELRRRLTFAADKLTAKVERQARAGKVSADDLTKAARAVAAVDPLLRAVEVPAEPPPTGNGKETPAPAEQDTSPLGAIAADLEREERSERARAAASARTSSA